MSAEPAGLYLHVPFCARKCGYCDFYSVVGGDERAFVRAVIREFEARRDGFDAFDTLYLGGGTPSVLSDEALCELIGALGGPLSRGAEITVEANPDDLDAGRLARWRGAGVNRLSIGIQSLDDTLLRWLGRRHDGAQAVTAVAAARDAGFDDLSLDFMYGIPGQAADTWRATLDRAVEMGPEHLSCYQLTLAPGTPIGRLAAAGEIELPGDEESRDLFLATSATLRAAGFDHYEISTFARPGHRARHNSKYWRRTPYLGLGPSAHSFDGLQRWWNVRSVERYRDLASAVDATETVDAEQARLETLMLGLRTSDGVPIDVVDSDRAVVVESLVQRGLIVAGPGHIRPTPAGMVVADALARDLA
jgi:putative oxygen-independent coproporphyrinogen III oxidase